MSLHHLETFGVDLVWWSQPLELLADSHNLSCQSMHLYIISLCLFGPLVVVQLPLCHLVLVGFD